MKIRITKNVYTNICEASNAMGEYRDCTVKALAIATRTPYATAHATMQAFGRPNRRGASMLALFRGLSSLGYEVKDVTERARKKGAKTVTTWPKAKMAASKMYIIETRGHVLAAKGSEVYDWSEGRRLRVLKVYEVVKRKELSPISYK